ncbi:MAG: hypothetical protein PF569_01115 [Candidatus Woesearchaeota archaeon]|jgi:hypothetical protein|nr:hypothetical protein [Candidatus Woesearchaeota archaeon]
MKNLNKLLIIQLIVLIFTLNSAFSSNYYFNIEIDHDFVDSDEITCEVIYDDRDRTWVVDEDSDNYDLELEKNFDDFLEMDCDDDLDEINLRIYEIDTDDKVFQETYDNEDKFEYELDLVDKDEEWFSIEIDHNFGSSETIDCELTIDGTEFDYEFDADTDNDNLLIEMNYDDNIDFQCDDELKDMELIIYDDDEVEVFSKKYEEDDNLEFDNDDLDDKYELKIVIDHDFDGDDISCDLIVDNIEESNFDFDEDSTSSDLTIYAYFIDSFEFDCNDDIDEINLYIYDDNGDKIDSENYDDEDKFEYELNTGNYELFIQITNEFSSEDEIECDLIIDGEKEEDYELTDSSSFGDLRIEYQFENEFEFICEEEMEKFNVFIFNNFDFNDDQIDEREYLNTNKLKYVINEKEVIEEIIVEEIQEEPEIEVTVEIENNNNNNEINIDDELVTYENQQDSNLDENTLNDNNDENQQNLDSSKQEELIQENSNKSSNIGKIVIIAIIIFVFIFLIYVVFTNKEIFFDPKPKHKKKEKVNLDYLKKRK